MYGVLFDCDGVLVDSERWSCGAWLPVLKKRGIDAELADIEAFLGQSDATVLAHYARLTGQTLPDALIDEKEEVYFDLARGRLQTFSGLIDLLDALAHDRVPMAVASSGRPRKIGFSLEQVGLRERFAAVCSASEVAHGKPAPDLFLYAARRLYVPAARCIVIEDSIAGLQAALAAGMHAIGFCSSLPPKHLLDAGAHGVFSHYEELLPQLERAAATFLRK